MATPLTPLPRRPVDPAARAWGEEVRYRRTQLLKQSQTQLADDLGIHQTVVSKIERGQLVPSPRLQRALIDKLGLDDRTVVRLVKGAA